MSTQQWYATPQKKSLRARMRRHRIAYAFIAPTIFTMLLVHFIPTAQAIYMSLLDLKQSNLLLYLRAPFVGSKHYTDILGGILFGTNNAFVGELNQAFINTLWFTFWVNVGTLGLGLVLALLLNRKFRGRGIARTLVLIPWVIPTFVVGIIWNLVWLQEGGLANNILVHWLGIVDEPISWLLLENARTALIIPTIWRYVPFTTVMFLAGLQVIPPDLYEAASIDGANAWHSFRHITTPLLKPVLAVMLMFGIIYNLFGGFNIGFSLFGGPNYGKYADLLIPYVTRRTIQSQLFGFGAAASVLMMLMMMGFVAVWYRAFRSTLTAE